MNKHICITGAGGYIGSKMVEICLKAGYKVTALDRYFFGDNLKDLVGGNLIIAKDDTRSFNKEILRGVDVVFDLASISNDPSSELMPEITESINYYGAVNVAKASKEMGVKKYVLSSSCSVYGAGDSILDETSSTSPISTYARCKLAAEANILTLGDKNFSVTSLRNGTVYGLSSRRMRFDLIINIMTLYAWKSNKIFIMGGGQQWRPLVHINDVIKAFLSVAEEKDVSKINGQIFNVGSNEQNYQVFQVAARFNAHFPGLKIETTPDDPDPRNYHVNFDKITNILGYKTEKTIDDGIVEIKEALDAGLAKDDATTRTVEYYKYLISADKLLSSVKLGGRLF